MWYDDTAKKGYDWSFYDGNNGNASGNGNQNSDYDDDDDDDEDYTPSDKGSGSGSSAATGDVYEAIDLINAERAKAKLPAYEIDSDLMEMAAIRAEEIAEVYDANHTRPDGRTFESILTDFGWELHKYSENAYRGTTIPTATQAVEGWMNPPGHKAHILRDNFTKVGVGYYYDSSNRNHCWIMLVTN